MEQIHETIVATVVAERARLAFLPRHFDTQMGVAERAVTMQLRELSVDYDGGRWEFYDLSNGGCYLAPAEKSVYRLVVAGNGFTGTLGADATGILTTLFALNRLAFRFPSRSVYGERYYQLRDFALGHAERRRILAAID